MDLDTVIARLAHDAEAIAALCAGVSAEQARWKPAAEQWSVIEIVNHLADEEVRDFRTRLDLTLHRPEEAWPPIDPPAWARDERYNERDLAVSLARFRGERGRSIEWLRSLRRPDWGAVHRHPQLGEMRAGDLLLSWLAHDLLHVRQLSRVLYQRWTRIEAGCASPSYRAEYAGKLYDSGN